MIFCCPRYEESVTRDMFGPFQIRVEMMKERATSMKEQEVRLGAMMAQVQMEKAKEVHLFYL